MLLAVISAARAIIAVRGNRAVAHHQNTLSYRQGVLLCNSQLSISTLVSIQAPASDNEASQEWGGRVNHP